METQQNESNRGHSQTSVPRFTISALCVCVKLPLSQTSFSFIDHLILSRLRDTSVHCSGSVKYAVFLNPACHYRPQGCFAPPTTRTLWKRLTTVKRCCFAVWQHTQASTSLAYSYTFCYYSPPPNPPTPFSLCFHSSVEL